MRITKIFWLVFGIVLACALFVGGFGIGTNYSSTNMSSSYEEGFSAGMAEAKDIIDKSKVFPPEAATITAVSGKIVALGDNELTIMANPVSMNPLADQGPETRRIKVTDKTQIFVKINKDANEVNKDFKTYQEAVKKDRSAEPPLPYKEIRADFSDLKLTMVVTVSGDGDLRDAAEINAETISFQTF